MVIELLIVFGVILIAALVIGFVVLFLGQIVVEYRKTTRKDKSDG